MNRFLSASLLATLCFLISCSEDNVKEPDYPIEPFIEDADIKFVEGHVFDSLILSFYFRDGDMDLGFNTELRSDGDYPYHPINYFLEDNGSLVMITTKEFNSRPFLSIPTDQHGMLVSCGTRRKADLDFLPEFNCYDYTFDSVYVLESNKEVFDETYNLIKSINNPEGYHLLDTFYYEVNQNHYNITVDYLIKQPDDSFIEYDLRKDFCYNGFNGRFPILSGIRKGMDVVSGPFKVRGYSSKEGEIRYFMKSTGFKTLFGGKTIKLRIKIKDRALHDSNVIETNEIQI